MSFLATVADACFAAGWECGPSEAGWVGATHPAAFGPDQGWKLHVSATARNAEEVLQRVLPVLLAEPCAFKVAASSEQLAGLNDGGGGRSQIGKFITVYPVDDGQ